MNDKRKLDLKNYKNQSKKDFARYVWWMEESVVNGLQRLCNYNNETYASPVLRYIVDWACVKMETDEQFKEYIQEITLKSHNTNAECKIKKGYTLSKDVNEKLLATKQKYRLYNLSYFVNESVKQFLKEH